MHSMKFDKNAYRKFQNKDEAAEWGQVCNKTYNKNLPKL